MKNIRLTILFLYLLWGIAFILNVFNSPSLAVFSYITFFQFFVPGLTLGVSLGLGKRSFTEVILYSFILSYIIYLVAALPTIFSRIEWQFFVGLNVFLYLIVLAIFIVKSYRVPVFKLSKPEKNEIFVVAFGMLVLLLFTYINFRSDASQYNNRIASSRQSKYVEAVYSSAWIPCDDGSVSREPLKSYIHDYKPFFNFLALPLRYSAVEQRHGWFIFNKLFAFLSIIAVYCLGRKLLDSLCGFLSLLFFLFTIFVFGLYYGVGHITNSGILFAQAAYNRHVSEHIFLFAFYLISIEAFKNRQKRSFLFAGLILFSMLSIHHFSFFWAVANFFLFSIIIFAVSAYRTKNVFFEFKNFIKNNLYVISASVIYFILLIVLTNYGKDVIYFANTMRENYAGFYDAPTKVTCFMQFSKFFTKYNMLAIASVVIGMPLLLAKSIKGKDIASLFLLSNILLYVIVKSPLVYNWLMFHDMQIVANRLDGGLLFFVICAFMLEYFMQWLPWSKGHLMRVIGALMVITFAVFGTDNGFAKKLRYRPNAGYEYLRMTEYLKSIKEPSNDAEGFTVFTNMKTAVDVYAFLNAGVFQLRKELFWPLTLSQGRKDLDRLLFCSQTDEGALIEFISKNRVDYIVVPTEKTGYVGAENIPNFERAIAFYNKLERYKLIYLDEYYYVYQKRNG